MEDKRKSSLLFLLLTSVFMIILNYLLSETVSLVEKPAKEEEVVEETEQVEGDKLHKVYIDFNIESKKNYVNISTDEKYFSYKCYDDVDALDFISKLDNSIEYELINITIEGTYTYVIFKYIGTNEDDKIESSSGAET